MKPKFRAWDKETAEMCNVGALYFSRDYELEVVSVHLPSGYVVNRSLTQVILMQSTGLKDKNGVEIFEGDIIKTKTGTLQSVEYVRASVTKNWSETVAAFKCRQGDEYFYFDLATDEVTGNIYENPKLLEVSK